jgi:hypothetical protein
MQMLVLLLAYIGAWQRMADREWMYTGWESKTSEWIRETDAFLEQAFGPAAKRVDSDAVSLQHL